MISEEERQTKKIRVCQMMICALRKRKRKTGAVGARGLSGVPASWAELRGDPIQRGEGKGPDRGLILSGFPVVSRLSHVHVCFRAAGAAHGSSQATGQIGATAVATAMRDLSRISHLSGRSCWIVNPLRYSLGSFPLNHNGNSITSILQRRRLRLRK